MPLETLVIAAEIVTLKGSLGKLTQGLRESAQHTNQAILSSVPIRIVGRTFLTTLLKPGSRRPACTDNLRRLIAANQR